MIFPIDFAAPSGFPELLKTNGQTPIGWHLTLLTSYFQNYLEN
jgi:hypothetical protein